MPRARFYRTLLQLLAAGLLWAGLGMQVHAQVRDSPVIVGSKVDTEGALLGSMIALVLERAGIPVETRLQLGPTQRVREALLKGEIDIYPEYTGNGAFFHRMEADPAWKSPAMAYETVKRLDLQRHGLVWLTRAPANNTWLIAVRGDVARRNRLMTMTDFAQAVRGAADLRLAASAEFVESPAALPSFERIYGFQFPRDRITVYPGGSTAVTMKAAAQSRSGINAAMVYGTDGAIAALDLVVMKDVRGAQIVYEPTPVIRSAVLQRHPGIAKALAPVFASLTLAKLQALNAEIAVEERPPREVALRYLNNSGLKL